MTVYPKWITILFCLFFLMISPYFNQVTALDKNSIIMSRSIYLYQNNGKIVRIIIEHGSISRYIESVKKVRTNFYRVVTKTGIKGLIKRNHAAILPNDLKSSFVIVKLTLRLGPLTLTPGEMYPYKDKSNDIEFSEHTRSLDDAKPHVVTIAYVIYSVDKGKNVLKTEPKSFTSEELDKYFNVIDKDTTKKTPFLKWEMVKGNNKNFLSQEWGCEKKLEFNLTDEKSINLGGGLDIPFFKFFKLKFGADSLEKKEKKNIRILEDKNNSHRITFWELIDEGYRVRKVLLRIAVQRIAFCNRRTSQKFAYIFHLTDYPNIPEIDINQTWIDEKIEEEYKIKRGSKSPLKFSSLENQTAFRKIIEEDYPDLGSIDLGDYDTIDIIVDFLMRNAS